MADIMDKRQAGGTMRHKDSAVRMVGSARIVGLELSDCSSSLICNSGFFLEEAFYFSGVGCLDLSFESMKWSRCWLNPHHNLVWSSRSASFRSCIFSFCHRTFCSSVASEIIWLPLLLVLPFLFSPLAWAHLVLFAPFSTFFLSAFFSNSQSISKSRNLFQHRPFRHSPAIKRPEA